MGMRGTYELPGKLKLPRITGSVNIGPGWEAVNAFITYTISGVEGWAIDVEHKATRE